MDKQTHIGKGKNYICFFAISSYFSSHDYDIQHIKEDDIDMDYFVSGAGHLTDISTKHEVTPYMSYAM